MRNTAWGAEREWTVNDMKDRIIDTIKFFLLLYTMSMGFFLTYAFLFALIGFELTNSLMWISVGLALLSELAYVHWVIET